MINVTLETNNTLMMIDKATLGVTTGLRVGIMRAVEYLRGMVDQNLADGIFGINSPSKDIETKGGGGGGLRGSLATRLIGDGEEIVGIVGTNLRYARIQEQGGQINVTPKMKSFFWAKWFTTGNEKWKNMAMSRAGVINIPAHYYMNGTAKLERENISRLINKSITDGAV